MVINVDAHFSLQCSPFPWICQKPFLYKCERKVSRVPELGVSCAGRILRCLTEC